MTDQKIRTFPCFTDVAVIVSAGPWLHCLTVLFIDVLTVLFIDVLGYCTCSQPVSSPGPRVFCCDIQTHGWNVNITTEDLLLHG